MQGTCAASAWSSPGSQKVLGCLGQVYLLPYLVEEYATLVKPIKLWPNPRGHYRGLTRIPLRVRLAQRYTEKRKTRRCLQLALLARSASGRVPWSNVSSGVGWLAAQGAVVLLADRRVCPYLPPGSRVLPADSLRALPAQRAQDCDLTCRCRP
jgi:hypothetical protein